MKQIIFLVFMFLQVVGYSQVEEVVFKNDKGQIEQLGHISNIFIFSPDFPQFISDTADAIILNGDLIEYITSSSDFLLPIPLGSCLSFLNYSEINTTNLNFDGTKISGLKPKKELLNTAFLYLHAPYLWGGKTPFGIDCSGFTQMVYKLNGYKLFRDASQQALQGEALSFIEESEPGDLAFFDNDEGNITHVGIMMNDNYIIHASGKVRIDRLDHLGIYNVDTGRHTHKLRVIKKII